jgi:hypothetical protein
LGVVGILRAEGLKQGGFFDVNAVEERGGTGHEDDGEAEPIAGVQGHGEEDQQQAEIRRMADEAVKTGAVKLLRVEDGDVRTEGFAEGVDGNPTNDKAADQDAQGEWTDGEGTAEHVVRVTFAVPDAGGEGREDNHPEKDKRAAIAGFAGTVFGAGGDANEHFGSDPEPIEDAPEQGNGHGDSLGRGCGAAGSAVWRRSHLLP